MNNVQILGTITRQIELKYAGNGTAIAKFGIAYNDRYTKNGERKEKNHFFDVVAFAKTAENINQYFDKGQRILISGSLDYESWEDNNGQKRNKVSIKLNGFDFIEKGNKPQQQAQQPSQQQMNYAQPQQAVTPASTYEEYDQDESIPF